MIDVQHVNPSGSDQRERALRGDSLNDRCLDVRLCHCEAARARIVDIAATQIARPEIVESAVLDKDGDGSIILVGYRNAPSTDDLAVDSNERQCGVVAQEDLAPYCGHDRCTPCRAGRS